MNLNCTLTARLQVICPIPKCTNMPGETSGVARGGRGPHGRPILEKNYDGGERCLIHNHNSQTQSTLYSGFQDSCVRFFPSLSGGPLQCKTLPTTLGRFRRHLTTPKCADRLESSPGEGFGKRGDVSTSHCRQERVAPRGGPVRSPV